MRDGIQTTRVAERFSSHTLARSRPSRSTISKHAKALRERLIAAAVETIAAGGDPRLAKTRAPA